RDLKPANILVGNFGEVQVIDWGFGKVLGRAEPAPADDDIRTRIATVRSGSEGSDSLVGSVMGTPAYMPPEQALGHIDELDEQTDVFALGAILCEILTGAPAYTGSSKDLLVLASQARLDDAYSRLANCGADAAIVSICKKALAPLRDQRFADGGELAGEISSYLTAAEERARQAEVDAIAEQGRLEDERARARWERRAKYRVRTLAAVVLLAVLLGGGLWFQENAREQARVADARLPFEDSMQDATMLAGRAHWDEALAVAHKAAALAADPDMTRGAAALVAEIERKKRAAEVEASQKANDAALLRALEDLRLIWFEDDKPKYEREFVRAFEAYGLDLHEPDAAARLRARGDEFSVEVVAALDDWIWLRKELLARDDWKQLLAVADAATSNAEHRRLRKPILARDRAALRKIAAEEDHQDLGRRGQFALANALWSVGDANGAVGLLRRWRGERPDDFWLHCLLGRIQEVRATDEALDAYRVALSLRPNHRELLHRLGILLHQKKEQDAALLVWKKGLALDPDDGHLRSHVAEILLERGDSDGAYAEARRAVARDADDRTHGVYGQVLARRKREKRGVPPKTAEAYADMARAHLDGRRLREARAAAREAVRIDPDFAAAHHALGTALLYSGRFESAVASHRRAVELEPDDAQRLHGLGIALRLAGHPEEAIAVLTAAVRLRPDRTRIQIELGSALFELARYADSLEVCRHIVRLSPGDALGYQRMANALYSLGRYEQASESAREGLRGLLPDARNAITRGHLLRLLGLSLFMQGKSANAFSAYREAIELGNRNARDTLVAHLLDAGEFEDALRDSGRASRAFADRCRRMQDLRVNLPLLSRGDFEPATVAEWVDLGSLCFCLRRYGDGVRCFAEALKRDPDEAVRRVRGVELVCSAVRTGPAHRAQAKQLIAAYLDVVERVQIKRQPFTVYNTMTRLSARAYLASVRDAPEWRPLWTRIDSIRRRAITPGTAPYYAGRARRLARSGRWQGVIPACREAIRLDPRVDEEIRTLLVQALYVRLYFDEAETACVDARRRHPDRAQLCNLHAICLHAQGRLDEAAAACRAGLAIEINADLHHTLGSIHYAAGDLDAALAETRRAIEIRGRDSRGEFLKSKYQLARILLHRNCAQALAASKESGLLGAMDLTLRLERLAWVEPHLKGVVTGERKPADAREAALFGELCYARGHNREATRYFRDAFEEAPQLEAIYARMAGVSAVRAAAALPAGASRTARLQQARAWFEADLNHLRETFDQDPSKVHQLLVEWPAAWIPAVVEAGPLRELPAAEREAWESFHAERAAFRAQVEKEMR
ncbi:MAG: tetratricopeptide repeat protein, partial [Planctomycetota bacterium]